MSAVAADGLTKRFEFVHALRDISFSLPRRAALLVVGPNGSGKTTLLRLLATATRPSSGSARVFGHDLVREADAVRQLTTFVGTAGGVYEGLTARENLRFAATMSGKADASEKLLRFVGLGSVTNRPVRTFSQGMKRRLALARAWLLAPRLLLLDEPFSGMDAEGIELVEMLIQDVRSRDGSIVLATHEWERGLALADTVLALSEGRQMEVAAARDFSAPRVRLSSGEPR